MTTDPRFETFGSRGVSLRDELGGVFTDQRLHDRIGYSDARRHLLAEMMLGTITWDRALGKPRPFSCCSRGSLSSTKGSGSGAFSVGWLAGLQARHCKRRRPRGGLIEDVATANRAARARRVGAGADPFLSEPTVSRGPVFRSFPPDESFAS